MDEKINIRGRAKIGKGCNPYLIAEIGTNHNKEINVARDLIKAIADAGFDCAKFQTYEVDEIVGENVTSSNYGLEKFFGNIPATEMFEKYLKTPKEWFPELLYTCHECGIDCATTIHGSNGLMWANKIGFDLIKIASMDHDNLPFLRSLVNVIKVPILISFGMANLEDIDAAVETLSPHKYGFGIFHCVSIYPPKPHELRLGNIKFLQNRFNKVIGLSDHSDDVITSLAAVALNASMFEKHVTLNRKSLGPDHSFALEPEQMSLYVQGIRTLANRIAAQDFESPTEREAKIRSSYLKSMVLACDLAKGSIIDSKDLVFIRPGIGISPKEIDNIVGKKLIRPLKKGDIVSWDDLEI